MNAAQLIKYMKDPQKMEHLPYEELKTVLLQFPYATNLRLLLLQKSLISNHEEYERDLHLAAAYAKDRDHLFRKLKETRHAMETQDAFFFESSQSTDDNGVAVDQGVKVIDQAKEPEGISNNETGTDDEGIRSFEEVINIEDLPAAAQALDDLQDEWQSMDRSSSGETIHEIPKEDQGSRDAAQRIEKQISDEDQDDPFLAWLSNQLPTSEVMPQEDRINIRQTAVDNTHAKQEDHAVVKKAARSLLEQDEVASETLARILEEQQQYGKAIEMYERLSLIFPEKSHLFADRIKQLKNK